MLSGPAADTTVTDSAGSYAFTGLPAGAFTIVQEQESGWLQSWPPAYGPHSFTVTDGLDSTGLDFGNFYSAANAFPVSAGWNILSLPVLVANPTVDSLYPNATSSVSLYANGYYTADTIPVGKGYWVKFPSTQNILLEGLERTRDTLDVVQGWNLVGSLSSPVTVASVLQEPDGIIASKFYGYRNTGYQGLTPDSSLLPHTGYWVKCSSAGTLILDAGLASRLSPSRLGGEDDRGRRPV